MRDRLSPPSGSLNTAFEPDSAGTSCSIRTTRSYGSNGRTGGRAIGDRVRDLEKRLTEVEQGSARREQAALTTARSLQEIATHWDAAYEVMRRAEQRD